MHYTRKVLVEDQYGEWRTFRSSIVSRIWRRVLDSPPKSFSTQRMFALTCLQPAHILNETMTPPHHRLFLGPHALGSAHRSNSSGMFRQQKSCCAVGLRFVSSLAFLLRLKSSFFAFAVFLSQLHLQAWHAHSSALSASQVDKRIYWYNGELHGKLCWTERDFCHFKHILLN